VEYLQIKNWEKFQHYKERNPPWIKLYHTTLDDYEYSCLQDASKLLLISLWMLAGKMNNKIPADPNWIQQKAMLKNKISLKPLIDAGFVTVFKNDSKMIASCYQDDRPETETETETEEVTPTPSNNIPYQKIVDLYHEVLPELPRVKILTPTRKSQIKARWLSKYKLSDGTPIDTLDFWKGYFEFVSKSKFLMGQNDRNWKPDLEWLTKESKFAGVIEGKHH